MHIATSCFPATMFQISPSGQTRLVLEEKEAAAKTSDTRWWATGGKCPHLSLVDCSAASIINLKQYHSEIGMFGQGPLLTSNQHCFIDSAISRCHNAWGGPSLIQPSTKHPSLSTKCLLPLLCTSSGGGSRVLAIGPRRKARPCSITPGPWYVSSRLLLRIHLKPIKVAAITMRGVAPYRFVHYQMTIIIVMLVQSLQRYKPRVNRMRLFRHLLMFCSEQNIELIPPLVHGGRIGQTTLDQLKTLTYTHPKIQGRCFELGNVII